MNKVNVTADRGPEIPPGPGASGSPDGVLRALTVASSGRILQGVELLDT